MATTCYNSSLEMFVGGPKSLGLVLDTPDFFTCTAFIYRSCPAFCYLISDIKSLTGFPGLKRFRPSQMCLGWGGIACRVI